MKLEGAYTFDAPRDAVWEALLDPDILAKTMPGCEQLERVGQNEYKGALKIKVGPVQGEFQGQVKLLDINPPESYRLEIDGKGAPGFMKGVGQVRLEPRNSQTIIHYSGEAQVGGRIASVGQRLLDSSAKALTRQSLDNLNKLIQTRLQAEAAPAASPGPATAPPPPPLEAPSFIEFAFGVAKNMLEDMAPPKRQPRLIAAGLGLLGLILILNWWVKAVARQAANEALERRFN